MELLGNTVAFPADGQVFQRLGIIGQFLVGLFQRMALFAQPANHYADEQTDYQKSKNLAHYREQGGAQGGIVARYDG